LLGRKVIPLVQVFARVSPEQKELVLQVRIQLAMLFTCLQHTASLEGPSCC
jgi:hypothetical protein